MPESPKFFLVAGESSGDLLGAGLMRGLKKLTGGKAGFAGVGGERMSAEGLEAIFPYEELAHVGVFELVLHLPRLLRRIRQTVEEIKRLQPVAVVTIDSPDFNFRVAERLKKEKPEIPVIHYVAPSVWAWRPGRARRAARIFDQLMTLLPFEPPYFTREGLPSEFVGHPIVESGADKGDAERFRAKYNVPENAPVLVVLPGSRASEINRLLPVFRKAVDLVSMKNCCLHVVMPTVRTVEERVKKDSCDWPVSVIVTLEDQDKYDSFAAATAALACSGTVSVELAMAKLPSVIAYKVNPLTAVLLRRLVKTEHATLINIMQGKAVMPEYLQEKCTPENLAAAVHELLNDSAARARQKHELDAVAVWLGQGRFVPSERAARVVLEAALRVAEKKNS